MGRFYSFRSILSAPSLHVTSPRCVPLNSSAPPALVQDRGVLVACAKPGLRPPAYAGMGISTTRWRQPALRELPVWWGDGTGFRKLDPHPTPVQKWEAGPTASEEALDMNMYLTPTLRQHASRFAGASLYGPAGQEGLLNTFHRSTELK